jgi:hypothetical protein
MGRQRLCRESLLTMRARHVRLSDRASTTSRALLPCSAWGMPLMPANMPAEARCQEDRGINAETWLRDSGMVTQQLLEYSFMN